MEEPNLKHETERLHMGLYGWRKRCLFCVVLMMLVVMTINIVLMLWIWKVLQLNLHGMTHIQMVGNGLQFAGATVVQDTLVAAGLFTRPGEVSSLQGADQVDLRILDLSGNTASDLQLGRGKLKINSPRLKVRDSRGRTLFAVDKETVSLATTSLKISGEGGAVFEGSLQTPLVSADISSNLMLESATKGVHAITSSGVSIESKAGDILATSHQDINLITIDGSIKLESGNVLIPNLKYPQSSHHLRKHHHHQDRIYQLCVCGNGELFLGEAESFCDSAANTELCRQ